MVSGYLVAKANELERCNRSNSSNSNRGSAVAQTRTAAEKDLGYVEALGAGAEGMCSDSEGSAKGEDTDSLECLAAFLAGGEGGRWRTDWPEEDRASFQKGMYAFRRDFHRVRAKFLPHRGYGDVVDYFYR